MDDALLVRRFERLGDLPRDRQRLVERDRASRDPLGQRRRPRPAPSPARWSPSELLQAVDVRDVRMVQRREDFRFALEAREALGSARQRLGQHLDRDLALQLGVGGAIDLAHAAGAEADRISYGPRRVPGVSVRGGKWPILARTDARTRITNRVVALWLPIQT